MKEFVNIHGAEERDLFLAVGSVRSALTITPKRTIINVNGETCVELLVSRHYDKSRYLIELSNWCLLSKTSVCHISRLIDVTLAL